MMENRRVCIGLDVLKVIFALLITILHLKPTMLFGEEITFVVTNAITRVGVPGFFFLTGYLYKINGKELSDWGVVKRHIKRMLILYTAWTMVFMPMIIYDFIINPKYEGFSVMLMLAIFIRRFFLIGSYTPLWFFLGGVYGTALIFILYKMHLSERAILIVLGIFTCIVACLNDCYTPIGQMFFGSYEAMAEVMELLHHYIGHIWKEAIWGAFYMALGSWAVKYRVKMINTDYKRIVLLTILIFGLIMEVCFMRSWGATEFSKMITIIPIVIILVDFFAGRDFSKITDKQSRELRTISILIYGFHIISSSYFKENLIPNSLFRYIVNMAITVLASISVVKFSQKKQGKFLRVLY